MSVRLSDLWRWDGTIDRGPYLLIGLAGFALKHNLDRFLASWVFGRPWGLFNYWIPLDRAVQLTDLKPDEALFLATMVLLALPFIYIGVALTVRRLRAVGLPLWLAALFFVPVVNLFFFLLLSVLPSKPAATEGVPAGARAARFLDRLIPTGVIGSALVSLLLTLIFALLIIVLGVEVFFEYGWGLFVGLPFAQGLLSVLLYARHERRGLGGCLLVSFLSVLLTALALLALAIEGVICVFMAAPLAVILAAIGATLGYFIQKHALRPTAAPAAMLVVALGVPGVMGLEALDPAPSPLFEVSTTVEVDAPPEAVWAHVVAFTEIPEPDDWLFQLGIAYPVRAEIHGQGVGAVRSCEFSTGSFIEPIEVWDAPRQLKFGVVSNPAPMQEWTLYNEIHPPHLDNFLVSRGGRFLLTPLPGGRTRLEGTTWYHHHMWPAAYWQLWSDAIIHRIHRRVLRHVKQQAESKSPAGREPAPQP